jgi:hypothetical protein
VAVQRKTLPTGVNALREHLSEQGVRRLA